MPTPILGGRPDLDQDVDTLALFITGTLPNAAPLVAYEGRLQIHNAVGACQVDQVSGSALPPGSQLYVDQDTDEIVLAWPAYSSSAAALTNPGFDLGDTSGWAFEYKGGTGSVGVDTQYRHQGTHSLKFTGARGLGSEGGVELSAVNNAAGVAYPNQRVNASIRGMYNPAGHNFGCRYQARLRWLDGLGATINESLGTVVKGRSNNGDWIQANVSGVAPAGTESVKLVGWATSKGAPTWLDTALWDLPVTIGINVDTVLSLTLRLRDSAGRTALWTGTVNVTSVDPLALSIYNKLAAAWGMHESSAGAAGVTRAVSKANTANNLVDGGAGFVASTTGLRVGQSAAKFGDGSGQALNGPAGDGPNDVVSVISGQGFCVFGIFWAETLGDTNRTLVAKTLDFSAANTEFSLFSFSGGLRFSVRGPVTREIDAPNPTTGAWHAVRAWVEDGDMFPRIQTTPLSSGLPGTKYSHTLACNPTPNNSTFSFARGGTFFPLGDATNEGRLQDWYWMRGTGNFLTDAEWEWMLNGGQWRTYAELYAAAGSP